VIRGRGDPLLLTTKQKIKTNKIDMSDNNNTTVTSSGIGFFGLLGVLFIGLKLTGVITWSWVWVLSPIWGILLVKLFFLALLGVVIFIGSRKLDK